MRSPLIIKLLKFWFILTVIIFIVNLKSNAQSEILDSIKTRFTGFAEKSFQEKIFLHVDKSFFIAGDILWFKAYVVDGSSHKPADLSKVAYVEILDSLQNSVLQAKISIQKGFGNGSFILPASLNSGNYKIRAYTNWMKNFSPEFYFEEFISIINYGKSLPNNVFEKSFTPDIQFFPEGGNLVENLSSKVAFKITAADKMVLQFNGCIIDQNNDTIVRFQPYREGTGEFNFTPQSGKKYRSVLVINNRKFSRDLPEILRSGYVMSVSNNNAQQLQIRVNHTTNLPDKVYLLIHTRQVIKVAQSSDFNSKQLVFNVNKDLLGDGISHITIFDKDKRPVAERLFYKYPQNKLNIQASLSAKQQEKRKKVEIEIASTDPGGKVLPANLSIAVYRQDSLPVFNHHQLLTYLWLSSDLKGRIENADQYLSSESPANNKALDLLMLTQGWRRFTWEQILDNKPPSFSFIPEFEGHIINSKVVHKQTGQAAAGLSTFLSIPGKRIQLYQGKSDGHGKISFFTRDLYGGNEMILASNFAIDSIYETILSNPFSERFSEKRIPGLRLAPTIVKGLNIYFVNKQIRDVYPQSRNQFYIPSIDSTAFFGSADVTYNLDDYTRFPTMEEVLKEYIPEVLLQQRQKKASLRVAFSDKKGLYNRNAFLMIDGVPIFDTDKILAFDPLKIKSIEIVNHRYLLNEHIEEGIIIFKTYQNDLAGFELDPRSVVLDYEGLQLKREFYSPVYQTENEINSRLPDFRDLLFWESDVNTDQLGKAKLSFYTSDQAGNYKIVIQGISNSGFAGSVSENFTIRK